MRRLLTIGDTFLIRQRGLVVVPAPAVEECKGPGDVEVELRRPDGSIMLATLTLAWEFVSPTPAVVRWCCIFKALTKEDVPTGTEVWCDEGLFNQRGRSTR